MRSLEADLLSLALALHLRAPNGWPWQGGMRRRSSNLYTYALAVRLHVAGCPLDIYTQQQLNDNAIVHIGPALGPPELRLSPFCCRQQLAGRCRRRGRQGKVLDFLVRPYL